MLDEHTADRILSGLVLPEDAPPGYAEVARLILELGATAGRAFHGPALDGRVDSTGGAGRPASTARPTVGLGRAAVRWSVAVATAGIVLAAARRRRRPYAAGR